MADVDRFMALFSGLDSAYGTYKVDKPRQDGKQAGKAMVVRKAPSRELWIKHLEGAEPSLGIIPIRSDNSCSWGCIDIDQYPMEHTKLITKIQALSLPLLVCRSKSGGAHIFCFVKNKIPAAEMRKYLIGVAALRGVS